MKSHLNHKSSAFAQVGSHISQCWLVAVTESPKMSPAKHNKYLWAYSSHHPRWLRNGDAELQKSGPKPFPSCGSSFPQGFGECQLTEDRTCRTEQEEGLVVRSLAVSHSPPTLILLTRSYHVMNRPQGSLGNVVEVHPQENGE